jgi:hypothetical protein
MTVGIVCWSAYAHKEKPGLRSIPGNLLDLTIWQGDVKKLICREFLLIYERNGCASLCTCMFIACLDRSVFAESRYRGRVVELDVCPPADDRLVFSTAAENVSP